MGTHTKSLTQRIAAYFRRNPDEALTYADMALKFDCTEQQARVACDNIVHAYGMRRESVPLVRLVPREEEGPAS